MHSWQNGTRCRDGVNVLWCRSHLVWLVFEGSIPTCACFHLENFFVTCFSCFFFIDVVREKRGRQGEDAWSVGYETWTVLFTIKKGTIINSYASK